MIIKGYKYGRSSFPLTHAYNLFYKAQNSVERLVFVSIEKIFNFLLFEIIYEN